MNRVLAKLLGIFAWVWLVTSGYALYKIAMSSDKTIIKAAMEITPWKGTALLGILSSLLFIIAFLIPVTKLLKAKRRKEIHYANAIGEISIALAAIEEALERVLDAVDIVRSYEVSLFDKPNDKKLIVRARLSLWEVNDIPTKIAEIQQELKDRFEEIMPEAESVEYKVALASFMPKAKNKKAPKKKEEEEQAADRDPTEETDYFTGIKYPIPSDEEEEEE
ncbi:hypothetical protein ACFL6F_01170 [Planctomycetota bacterium]